MWDLLNGELDGSCIVCGSKLGSKENRFYPSNVISLFFLVNLYTWVTKALGLCKEVLVLQDLLMKRLERYKMHWTDWRGTSWYISKVNRKQKKKILVALKGCVLEPSSLTLLSVIWKITKSHLMYKDWQRTKFAREVSKEEQASGKGAGQS